MFKLRHRGTEASQWTLTVGASLADCPKPPMASTFPAELCAEQSCGFGAVGVDSWLVVVEVEKFRTRIYIGVIVFVIKETDSACPYYSYITLITFLNIP